MLHFAPPVIAAPAVRIAALDDAQERARLVA